MTLPILPPQMMLRMAGNWYKKPKTVGENQKAEKKKSCTEVQDFSYKGYKKDISGVLMEFELAQWE